MLCCWHIGGALSELLGPTCLKDSSTPIDDLTVASCAPFIFRNSHMPAPLDSGQNFNNDAKPEVVAFLPPSAPRQ